MFVSLRRGLLAAFLVLSASFQATAADKPEFPFKDGDRVAWVGSSSTNIGVWPKTMEFLLLTRHPELKLTFKKQSSGGGTFATGLEKLDGWLDEFKPTVVVFNYGGNDANAGEKGLPTFKSNIEKCVAKVKERNVRFLFTTNQAGDVRKSKEAPAERRKLYAEALLAFGNTKQWLVVDVFHPLEKLQEGGQKANEAFTILKDNIHLTDSAYIAWGYFLYQGLNPPKAASSAVLTAKGEVTETANCKIADLKATDNGLTFIREDRILPILPPLSPTGLPPAKFVPLEAFSDYRLTVTGLADGRYEVLCEGKPLGETDAAALAKGINLNTLLLDSGKPAPWEALAKQLWGGKEIEQVGKTKWAFVVRGK